MATTYTANPANVTPSAAPTETLPSDGDALAVVGVNGPMQKLLDFIANIFNLILNGFTAPVKVANQATALHPPSIWTAITPGAGWTAANGLAYWKDGVGVVHVKGSVTFATGGALNVFTFPAGFRPASPRLFTTASSLATYTESQFLIDGAGNVSSNTGAVNGHAYFLDSISFLAEQ